MTDVIEIQPRGGHGTGQARSLRREGHVPCIIYGGKKAPESVHASLKEMEKIVYEDGFYSRVYTLKANGSEQRVLIKDVQYHPVTDRVLHVDFMRVQSGATTKVFVPICYINADKSPAVKRGALLNTILRRIQIVSPVDAIPSGFHIDLGGIETRQSLTIDLIQLPEGASFVNPKRDRILATITGSSKVDASAEGEE